MSELVEQLAAALRAMPGVDAELCAVVTRAGSVRFAQSRLTQSTVLGECVVQARVALGRRIGIARTSERSVAALRDALAQASALAAQAPEIDHFRGFAGAQAYPLVGPAHDPATAALPPAARIGAVKAMFATADLYGCECAGAYATGEIELAVAGSAGACASHVTSYAKLGLIAQIGAGSAAPSGSSGFYHLSHASLDATALAEQACSVARRMRDPIELPPGRYDVVLEPPAVVESLEWIAMTAFSARTIEDGSSFLAGRAGERVTGAGVTWVDDAAQPASGVPAVPFDYEGVPKRAVTLVAAGVAQTGCHDLRSAARAGVTSTGHAPPPSDEADGPVATHVAMAPGEDTLESLIGRVERGLLVSRFHYVNGLGDPRRALQTGMTRDGLFWIENGRVGRGVRNLRFTEAMLDAFARMDGATAARQPVATSWTGAGGFVAPAVLLRGFHFTGST
jgi:predicted Zn-dependent protease